MGSSYNDSFFVFHRYLCKRIFGSSVFPCLGKVGILYLHVPRNHSVANDWFHTDTNVPIIFNHGMHINRLNIQPNIHVYTWFLQAWRCFGDIFFSILYAFVINIMIESPFDRLQKNLLKILARGKYDQINCIRKPRKSGQRRLSYFKSLCSSQYFVLQWNFLKTEFGRFASRILIRIPITNLPYVKYYRYFTYGKFHIKFHRHDECI